MIENTSIMALKKDLELNVNFIRNVKLQIPKPTKLQQAIEKLFKKNSYTKIVQS